MRYVWRMAEPFKEFINVALVRAASDAFKAAWPAFDAVRFCDLAANGLGKLELKARAMHVTDALEATLPQPFDAAAAVIEAAVGPPINDAQPAGGAVTTAGLAGWILWPVGEFVVRRGMDDPERALLTLHVITQRFTAEFAIRPFIVAHPDLVFRTLADWVHDESPHVRRLVSEGSRPRLPWGIRLQQLVADPLPTLPLLRALQDDSSEYVRRSVANHLNDIAKDHPELVAEWLEEHLPAASDARRALLKHASRTLIKQRDVRVLRAWGIGTPMRGSVEVQVAPRVVRVGEHVELSVRLVSTFARQQSLAVDYVVHFVKANGQTSPKVFKGWSLTLAAHEERVLVKRHSLKPITTRRYYPGEHTVAVQVNGVTVGRAVFALRAPTPARA